MPRYAYRTWRMNPLGVLHSPFAEHTWTAQGNHCQCTIVTKRLTYKPAEVRGLPLDVPCPDPPRAECTCGFYAYPSLDRAYHSLWHVAGPNCFGVVLISGIIHEHTDGVLRAEYMDIVAVAAMPMLARQKTGITEQEISRATAICRVPIQSFESWPEAERWLYLQEAESAAMYEPDEAVSMGGEEA